MKKILWMLALLFAVSANSYGEDSPSNPGQGFAGLLDQVATKVKNAAANAASGGPISRPARSIKDTELYKLFEQHPYDEKAEWPRVAITVDSYTYAMHRDQPPLGSECWVMHAKIWYSPKKAKDVETFSACGHGADYTFNERFFYNGMNEWSVGYPTAGKKHAGNKRDGSLYPQKTLPSAPGDNVFVAEIRPFLHIVMSNMSFDYSMNDPRVWFVKFNGRQKSPAPGAF